jgi:hypothetical protein
MARIREISASDNLTNTAIDALAEVAPALEDIEFYAQPGSSDTIYQDFDAAAKAKITRSLNEDNSATPPTPVPATLTKKIVSFDAKVDVVYADRGYDLPTAMIRQIQREARQAGFRLQYLIFEGDAAADAEDFNGLRKIASGSYTNENGVLVPAGNSDGVIEAQQLAVEAFLKEAQKLRAVNPIAYMNEDLLTRWVTVGKSLGYYRETIDEFGVPIPQIRNVILKGAGYDADGVPLLPFTEAVNGGNSSSVFFTQWGEADNVSALTSVGLIARDAGQSGNYLLTNINLDMVLGLQKPWALVLSQGWKLN